MKITQIPNAVAIVCREAGKPAGLLMFVDSNDFDGQTFEARMAAAERFAAKQAAGWEPVFPGANINLVPAYGRKQACNNNGEFD